MRFLLRWLLCLGMLLAAGAARAQSSTDPCLEVLNQQGQPVTFLCAGQTYTLNKCGPPPPAGTPIYYDTTGGVQFQFPGTSTLIKFAKPGRRVIKQLINVGGGGGIDSVAYEVYPTAKPRVRIVPCLRNVRVLTLDPTYGLYLVTYSLDNQPLTNASVGAGGSVATPPAAGVGAVMVHVTVKGFSIVPGSPFPACGSAEFDTTFTLPALPPLPRIQLLDVLAPTAAHQVRLRLERLQSGTRYLVERADALPAAGPWALAADTLRPTADTLSVTLNGAPTATRHRYRLRRVRGPGCDATLPEDVLLSNEAGALPLTSVSFSGTTATVAWPDYPAPGTVRAWRVRRDGRDIRRLPPTARTYLDPVAPGCPRPVCYEVVAVVQPPAAALADTLLAVSGDSCVLTPAAAPGAPYVTASFDASNNLLLRAKQVAPGVAASFDFSETRGGAPSTVLGTSPTPAFAVLAPDTAVVRETCYSATFTDTCAQVAPASAAACPTVLRARRSMDNLTVALRWTEYGGFAATYTVEVLDALTPAVTRTAPAGTALTYDDVLTNNQQQALRYRIRAEVPGDTTRLVYSNTVELTDEQVVRLPTAFTPNGDKLNDTFGPIGRYPLREQELTIYDRWGRELFHSTTPGQNWDGRPPGGTEVVAPGVFAYRFRGRDAAGHDFSQKGTVTVIR